MLQITGFQRVGYVGKDHQDGIRSIGYQRTKFQTKLGIKRIVFKVNKPVRLTHYTDRQRKALKRYILLPKDELDTVGFHRYSDIFNRWYHIIIIQISFSEWPLDHIALFSAEDETDLKSEDIEYLAIESCDSRKFF